MLAMSRITESLARTRARGLVESIANDHGYLGEDVLSQMPDDARRKVEKALAKKDEIIGSSVMTYENDGPSHFTYFRADARSFGTG